MQVKFEMTIASGNDALQAAPAEAVAKMLRDVADRIARAEPPMDSPGRSVLTGRVADENGNSVGTFNFTLVEEDDG